MKFITEDDLRDLYKVEPFTTYDLEPSTRLTPGARQFLVDRGIDMYGSDSCKNKNPLTAKGKAALLEKKKNWKSKKIKSKMNSVNALFLTTAEELLSRDVCLAQSLINLSKQFSCIKSMLDGKGLTENLNCQKCTGISEDNFSHSLEDCFEITDFHMQLEKGKEIVILHRLRCALQEIEPVLLEIYEGSEDDNVLCEVVMEKVNQIINTLSQMICSAFGGEKCQKQS